MANIVMNRRAGQKSALRFHGWSHSVSPLRSRLRRSMFAQPHLLSWEVMTLLMHRQPLAHTHTLLSASVTQSPPPCKMTRLGPPKCIVSLYQLLYTPDWLSFGIFLCSARVTLVFPASGKMPAISMK